MEKGFFITNLIKKSKKQNEKKLKSIFICEKYKNKVWKTQAIHL